MTIKINKKSFLIMVVLTIFTLNSMALFTVNTFTKNLPRILMPIIAVYFFYILIKRKALSSNSKLIILLYCMLLYSTVIGGKDYISYYRYAIQAIGAALVCNYYIKRDVYIFLKAFRNIMFIFISATIFMQLFTGGIIVDNGQTYYFIGSRIGFTSPYILTIFVSLLCDFFKYNRYKISGKTIIIAVLCAFSLFLESVSTGIVAIFLLFILVAVEGIRALRKVVNYWALLAIALFVCVMVVVFSRTSILASIIEILGEDLTFSSRTYIWASFEKEIIKQPIWGYGVDGISAIQFKINKYVADARPAHNNYLHILYEGGIVEFGIFMFILVNIGIKIMKCKNNLIKALISAIIFIYSIISITEIQVQRVWIFFVIAVSAEVLDYLNVKDTDNDRCRKEKQDGY